MNKVYSAAAVLMATGMVTYSTPSFGQDGESIIIEERVVPLQLPSPAIKEIPILSREAYRGTVPWGSDIQGEIGGDLKIYDTNKDGFDDVYQFYLNCPNGMQLIALYHGKYWHYDVSEDGIFQKSAKMTDFPLSVGMFVPPEEIIPKCKSG